ncbi:hypothetical protein Kazakh3189_02720 [Helicobacter pylori]
MTKRKRSNPLKKRGFKRGGSKEKGFFIKIPQKKKGFKKRKFKTKGSKNKGFKKKKKRERI